MKKLLLPLFAVTCLQASAANLWTDNFNTADTDNFDNAPLDGRLSGIAVGETTLRSFVSQQDIFSNQLALDPSGGVRFGEQTARYDWAGATTGGSILGSGGFVVTYDWTTSDNTDVEWVAWKMGTKNDDSNVNDGSVDHSLLMRKNGNTEVWENGSNQGPIGSFVTIDGGGTYQVSLAYTFSSFADGTVVDLVASVNGTLLTDSFTWNDNAGELRMEMHSGSGGNLIDNLAITTVPEPGAALLGLVGLAALVRRRR